MPQLITADWLARRCVHPNHTTLFAQAYPDGCALKPGALLALAQMGVSVDWAYPYLSEVHRQRCKKVRDTQWAAYRASIAALQRDDPVAYRSARSLARKRYELASAECLEPYIVDIVEAY